MSEREVVLDQPQVTDEQSEALRNATERAEKAEAELAKLKTAKAPARTSEETKQPPSPSTEINTADVEDEESPDVETSGSADTGGVEELRKDSMMAHLLDSLAAGKDIGHHGRLVFAMVARHFLPHDEVLRYLTHDKDFSNEQALLMLRQVEGRDYSPPKRERILEWQSQQDFPILPDPEDPDCGNLYRNLKFPTEIYDHIGHYQEEKLHSGE
ncbi:hypothetical protein [Granulicella tundricola]|uniref:Uncharacterized protein n=1 Tax=Granulicella tundricola (strain ATCC BAA-1859 / DSM 23138 / MP5ACTX9) TaxID=1198114 RepID=E8WZA4_GRATM|nr:hypothetical protein [Granulicella tundricola]ADW67706.1 hypothetical protein AciX9_0635 [Granulicella tundricola MP5ACTX9]